MKESTFLSNDGHSAVHWYEWDVENPVAVLQIVHGMSEYILRYEGFAEYLNKHGIVVVGNDHIGHGKSVATSDDWGYFGLNDGWMHFIEDVEKMRKIVQREYPGVPYYIMGHSMGSFVTRGWLKMFGEGIDGAIVMGTAGTNPALDAGQTMIKLIRKLKGDRHKSKLITAMAFGSYNKHIPHAKTPQDWLTRDAQIVARYVEDPACGFTFSAAGYADLFSLLYYIDGQRWFDKVPKDMPLFFVAGSEDPVGEYGKGPTEVVDGLKAAGCTKVSLKLYPDMRHEILNEIGKEEVMDDIRAYILGQNK